MKKIILASLSLLCGIVSFSQGTHSETRSITENGVTKTWTVVKEFDVRGNMIDYDSTYAESPANPNQFNDFGKDFSNDSFGNYRDKGNFGDMGDFGSMNMDSIMNDMNVKMDQMMQEMQQMMNSMMNNMPQMEELSPTPQDNRIIVPGHQNGQKSIGTRT